MVSTTWPETIARAPARSADRTRTRGKYQLISAKYKINQTKNAAATRQSIASNNKTDPNKDASAKATTLIASDATSVTARAHCICFWAIRPAKSSSKNVMFCPRVQRCSRDRTNGLTLGCTMMELDAADSPNAIGRIARKNPIAKAINQKFDPSKKLSGPKVVASMTMPRISAVIDSMAPAKADRAAASHSAGQDPAKHQRIKAPSSRGGGPSAGLKESIQLPIFIPVPLFSGSHQIAAPRTLHIGRLGPKARHGRRLRQSALHPILRSGPFER